MWAFGVLLWEIFAHGAVPYGDADQVTIMAWIQDHRTLQRPDECPDQVFDAMQSCWAIEPEGRPDMGEVGVRLHELFFQLQTQDMQAPGASTLSRTLRRSREDPMSTLLTPPSLTPVNLSEPSSPYSTLRRAPGRASPGLPSFAADRHQNPYHLTQRQAPDHQGPTAAEEEHDVAQEQAHANKHILRRNLRVNDKIKNGSAPPGTVV